MTKNYRKRSRHPVLKLSCLGAGLLSISNPLQVSAADIGIIDVHNNGSLGGIANPFPNQFGGVYVAAGDLDGDGFADIVVGPGTSGAQFARWNWIKGVQGGYASNTPSSAGVRVAVGDLNGDGKADIVVSPATGGTSEATVWTVETDLDNHVFVRDLSSTAAIFPEHSGGVSIAVGDLEGDGVKDVLAGRVACCRGYDIKKGKADLSFVDLEPTLPDGFTGLEIAMGDIDGDGADDILALPKSSPDGLAHPRVRDQKHKEWIEVPSLTAPLGVSVALGDLDGDGRADLVVGSPFGYDNYISYYALEQDPLVAGGFYAIHKMDFFPYDASFRGGVRVAVGDVNGDGFGDIVFGPAGVPEPATLIPMITSLGAWLFGGQWRRREKSSD
jgi:hypothetical protein